MKIYIAGPLTADANKEIAKNIMVAVDAALEVNNRGHTPLVPHLSWFILERALITGARIDYEDFMRWDLELLDVCDAMLFLAPSPGANREYKHAMKRGMKIYHSVEEIPNVK